MASIPFDIVGFDLDGTLLDTSGDLAAAVNYAIATDGRPPLPVEAIHPFVGKGAKVMLQRALDASGGYDDAMLARMLPILLDYYEQNLAIHSLPYPGLTAAMDALQAAGVKLAICTNKAERFTIPLLHQIGLSDRFASVVGGDTVGIAKPDPAPIHAMVERAGGRAGDLPGRYDQRHCRRAQCRHPQHRCQLRLPGWAGGGAGGRRRDPPL